MRQLRLVLRGSAFFSVLFVLWIAKTMATRMLKRHPVAERRWRNRLFRTWARLGGRIIGMRVHVTGTPPKPPFVLVSNHLGYIDIALLAQFLDADFVAKSEIAAWPFLGRVVTSVDTILIDRDNARDVLRANQAIAAALERGHGVVVFAEGTSSGGPEVLPLHPSLFQVPVQLGLPVHYAAISYSTPPGEPPASEAVCWWGDAEFAPHVKAMMQLPYFNADLRFGPAPLSGDNRKRLADTLRDAISDLKTSPCVAGEITFP